MTWQDDLQRLDEELAAGRLSADDYRRRRDELIAQVGTEQGGMTRQSPVGPPPGASGSPFPPAFRWDPVPSETTHVIEPVGDGLDDAESSEQTQVVRTPAQPPSAPPYNDSDSTQVIQAGPPPFGRPPNQQGGRFSPPSDPQPTWAREESAPPWASSDLPPILEPDASWTRQGPESFETETRAPGITRIVAVVAVVVVLAGIAFGAWFFWGRNVSNVADPGPQEPAVTTTEPEPEDPLAPADLGGTKEPKDVDSFDDLRGVRFLTEEELDALAAAGAEESRILITNFAEGKATVLVSEATSTRLAATARDALTELQIGYSFAPRDAPPGVNSVELLDKADSPPQLRALFTSGDLIVRIEMLGDNRRTSNTDLRELATKFEEILEQQLEKLPADV